MVAPEATFGQAEHLLDFFKKCTKDQLKNFFDNGDLVKLMLDADLSRVDRAAFAALLAGRLSLLGLETFSLTIDYTKSLDEMVAAGNYDDVDSNINWKNFLVWRGEAQIETVLIHLGRGTHSDEVLGELERRDLRPGTLVELLAFGEQYPDQQCNYAIIALGGVSWTGKPSSRVGSLRGRPGCRVLRSYWYGDGWGEDCRFLAVCK